MLVRKGKVGILDETVHQADQFTHDGDQADLGRFAVGFETLVKGREDGVATRCANGGHIEHVAHLRATTTDVARSAVFAGVSRVRCDSDQG